MVTLILVPSTQEWRHLVGEFPKSEMGRVRWTLVKDAVWAICGIGPAAAAMTTALLITQHRVKRVILAGIGGAFPESGLSVGDLVQANRETLVDLGYCDDQQARTLDDMGFTMLPLSDEEIGCSFPLEVLDSELVAGPFATVSSVSNSHRRAQTIFREHGCLVENMEGAGVALACAYFRIPCFQVRAVSNLVGPRESSKWSIEAPLAKLRQWLQRSI